MAAASNALVAALKASLGNPAHAWLVQSATEHDTVEPEPEGEVLYVTTRIVALESRYLGAQLVYEARLAPSFEGAKVSINGNAFSTSDADLYATITAMANSHAARLDSALVAFLTPPAGAVVPQAIVSSLTFGEPSVG